MSADGAHASGVDGSIWAPVKIDLVAKTATALTGEMGGCQTSVSPDGKYLLPTVISWRASSRYERRFSDAIQKGKSEIIGQLQNELWEDMFAPEVVKKMVGLKERIGYFAERERENV